MKSMDTSVNPPITENPITLHLNNRLSVRMYRDSQPNCLEIAPLQKGLLLMQDNEELVEEGIGFGVPVVKYADKTYFSSTAEAAFEDGDSPGIFRKSFVLDAVSRKRFGKTTYLNDDFYSFLRLIFEKPYLRSQVFKPLFDWIMEFRDKMNVKTDFVKVKPRGVVQVTYRCQSARINVSVDFSGLSLANCQEILVLNEQGAAFFRQYSDSEGLKLIGGKIGAWAVVAVEEASLSNIEGSVAFSLRRVNGARLSRGWEKIKNRFSWAGLSYSMQPKHGTFEYTIDLI